jgi:uncharacterized membrane protein YgcG
VRSRIATTIAAVLVVVMTALVAGVAGVAGAQSASDAAADLRVNDVTFEEGAPGLDQTELARLDNAAANLQRGDEVFKVVVLAEPVDDYATPREFAQVVLRNLGERGRVIVFDVDSVGIASNVGDTADEIERAEEAAADEANRTQSYAEGINAAADVLGVTGASPSPSGTASQAGDSDSGGSGAWLWVLLVIAALVVIGLLLWRWSRQAKGPPSTVSLGEGELKVRQHQDRAGNLVLELADRVEAPDAPTEARQLFRQGASEFAELQDDLEEADTRPRRCSMASPRRPSPLRSRCSRRRSHRRGRRRARPPLRRRARCRARTSLAGSTSRCRSRAAATGAWDRARG